eukprot:CAMPEP_0197443250 /NCGR_PEP_ID=MMETSP1175-20131217/9031_1 /TAXON_ID=1003142 /ORGANISM="Triceratium dubium, Strain CCMP147" /LENGTH=495 /DNA_ID=CAMNT_0042973853 /DNA_START=61 /DNA_END=1548 /DNA_ORIENTATION=+
MKLSVASRFLALAVGVLITGAPASADKGNWKWSLNSCCNSDDPLPGAPAKLYHSTGEDRLYVMTNAPVSVLFFDAANGQKTEETNGIVTQYDSNVERIAAHVSEDGGPVEYFVLFIRDRSSVPPVERVMRYDPPSANGTGTVVWDRPLANLTGDGANYSIPEYGNPIIEKRGGKLGRTDVYMNLSPGFVAKFDGQDGTALVGRVGSDSEEIELGGLTHFDVLGGSLFGARYTKDDECYRPTIFQFNATSLAVYKRKELSTDDPNACGSVRHNPVLGPNSVLYYSDRHLKMFLSRPIDIDITDETDLFGNGEWMPTAPGYIPSNSLFTFGGGMEYQYKFNSQDQDWAANNSVGSYKIDTPVRYRFDSVINNTVPIYAEYAWYCDGNGASGLDANNGFLSTYGGHEMRDGTYTDCAISEGEQLMYLSLSTGESRVEAWEMVHSTRPPQSAPSAMPSSMPTAAPSPKPTAAPSDAYGRTAASGMIATAGAALAIFFQG